MPTEEYLEQEWVWHPERSGFPPFRFIFCSSERFQHEHSVHKTGQCVRTAEIDKQRQPCPAMNVSDRANEHRNPARNAADQRNERMIFTPRHPQIRAGVIQSHYPYSNECEKAGKYPLHIEHPQHCADALSSSPHHQVQRKTHNRRAAARALLRLPADRN